MKNFISLIILITFFCSCNNTNVKVVEEKKSKLDRGYEVADKLIGYEGYKIGLLSIIKDVPLEQTKLVLRDYLAKSYAYNKYDSDYIIKLIDTISKKNNLSKKLTASLIFGYEYEMITRDEIKEETIEEMKEHEYKEY